MSERSDLATRAALGMVGGLAGTLAIQALMGASQRWLPQALPPVREEPGAFMVEQAERVLPPSVRDHVPEGVEQVAARVLGVGYGLAFGAAYAMLRPRGGPTVQDGLILGAACWAAGYLGWLPAMGLIPPVWRQKAPQVIGPAAEHLAYGVATVATYDWLVQHAGAEDGRLKSAQQEM